MDRQELVFAFYHEGLRKVALVAVPGEAHRKDAIAFVAKKAIVLPFDKVCSWCGRAAEHLRKCPCKEVRYCNADCQGRHWGLHKPECPGVKCPP